MPAVFTKYPASLGGPFDPIVLSGEMVDWEVELVVVIGRRADRVAEADGVGPRRRPLRRPGRVRPHGAVRGRRPVLAGQVVPDATGRPGPGWSPPTSWPTPTTSAIGCSIDGEVVQEDRTSGLVFPVPRLVAELSAVVPLLPGDLIFTGTPAGVGVTRQPPRFLRAGRGARELDRGHRHHPQPGRRPRRRRIVSHAIELGYLRVEVDRARRRSAASSPTSIGLAPGEPDPGGRADLDRRRRRPPDHRRPRARPTTSPPSGSRPSTPPPSTRRSPGWPRPASRPTTAARPGRRARRVERLAVVDAPWGCPVEVVLGLERPAGTRPDAARARRVPHRRPGLRPRRRRHHRLRRVGALRHRGPGHGTSPTGWRWSWRPGSDAGGALLPLQRPPPQPGPGPGAVRAAPARCTT